jgi:integrase
MGRRDDAQYLLFCAYGLSSTEVTNLTLEDIDWHAGILHVRRVKNGATVICLCCPRSPRPLRSIFDAHVLRAPAGMCSFVTPFHLAR